MCFREDTLLVYFIFMINRRADNSSKKIDFVELEIFTTSFSINRVNGIDYLVTR